MAGGVAAVALLVWIGAGWFGGGDDEPSFAVVGDDGVDSSTTTLLGPWPPRSPRTTNTEPSASAATIVAALPPTSAGADGPGTTEPTPSATGSLPGTTSLPAQTIPASSVPSTTGPSAEPEPTAAATAAPSDDGPSYPVQADGTPIPVEVVFDDDTITLTGTVPDEAAIERMTALAIANSKNPDAEVVADLVIDANVPDTVGVRVIELNSPRFPAGSADLTDDHKSELDRVVSLMMALENVNVLVIGHADQRGDEATNFAISENRALSVVSYFVEQGIAPQRTSLRAVGEDNPLSLSEEQAALELNRRTEFVFTGLLLD